MALGSPKVFGSVGQQPFFLLDVADQKNIFRISETCCYNCYNWYKIIKTTVEELKEVKRTS